MEADTDLRSDVDCSVGLEACADFRAGSVIDLVEGEVCESCGWPEEEHDAAPPKAVVRPMVAPDRRAS